LHGEIQNRFVQIVFPEKFEMIDLKKL